MIRPLFYVWTVALLTVGVVGCARTSALPASDGASSQPASQSPHRGYKQIYAFRGGFLGSVPFGGVTVVNGRIFGTTIFGGFASACPPGCGTVFAGTKPIYSFKGPSRKDGEKPNGDLLLVGNTLYGTTMGGGNDSGVCSDDGYTNGCGTVFAIDFKGRERVVYRFNGGSDGADPKSGLIAIDGTLYGTTYAGGINCQYSSSPSGCGVVFSIDSSGKESVLHRFAGPPDAANPNAALLAVGGTLYGTSEFGGKCQFSNGCGTVFKINVSGGESVVYSFKGKKDGSHPKSPLSYANASLYGITIEGGCTSACYSGAGGGTLFSMSLDGNEKIIHRFAGNGDGSFPSGRLVFQGGELYGTTFSGGTHEEGTIFSASSAGIKILHSFGGSPDGSIPWGLTPRGSQGQLYGTTQAGGTSGYGGAGTIFRYTP